MYTFITVFLALIFIFLSVCFITFSHTFHTKRNLHATLYQGLDGELDDKKKKRRSAIETLSSLPYEEVWIKSFDGKRLFARYYHKSDAAPIIIQLHGYRSMALRDFSNAALECMELGYNVLLTDERSHGKSEGNIISFGIKERFDALSWVYYSRARFSEGSQIFLYGISMGAATALMACELNLPKSVKGIIADCPFSSPSEIIKKVSRDRGLPSGLLYPFIKLGAMIFGGFNLERTSPLSAVKKAKIPILLLHGTEDSFVPASMSDKIAAASERAEYVKIKDAPHALSILYDRDLYVSSIKTFVEKHSKGVTLNEN